MNLTLEQITAIAELLEPGPHTLGTYYAYWGRVPNITSTGTTYFEWRPTMQRLTQADMLKALPGCAVVYYGTNWSVVFRHSNTNYQKSGADLFDVLQQALLRLAALKATPKPIEVAYDSDVTDARHALRATPTAPRYYEIEWTSEWEDPGPLGHVYYNGRHWIFNATPDHIMQVPAYLLVPLAELIEKLPRPI